MDKLMAQFIEEARDLISKAGLGLLMLEKNPGDPDLVDSVFRDIHTLKGSGGVLEIQALVALLHAAEELLEHGRRDPQALNADGIDALLSTLDLLGGWIDTLDRDETLPTDAAQSGSDLIQQLESLTLRLFKTGGKTETVAPSDGKGVAWGLFDEPPSATTDKPDWLDRLDDAQRQAVDAALTRDRPVHWVVWQPADDSFFQGEDPFARVAQTPGLLALDLDFEPDAGDPEQCDVYQCRSVFRFVCASTDTEIRDHINDDGRLDMGLLSTGSFSAGPEMTQSALEPIPESLIGERSLQRLDPNLPDLGSVLRDQQTLLDLCDAEVRSGAFASAHTVLGNASRALGRHLPDSVANASNAEVLKAALDDWLHDASEPAASAMSDRSATPIPKQETESIPSAPVATSSGPAKEPPPVKRIPEPATRDSQAPVIRTFKIDQEEVERLGDLVGELVVAKNALPFLAQRAEEVFGQRQLGREIREQFNVINRITRALQDAMMQVQMLPVSYVFERFPRLVRDLSRKLDKAIDLQIEGEDTEAEKHVIECLSDPLVHLMRNSIDHGIESREQRQRVGKPEAGTIHLSARQDQEWVVIEVTDDGAGIDPEKNKLKAYEKGLVDERKLKEISDQEAIDLIFTPGFSTLDTASDLSGRGVGMDVVRNTVEKAGGRVTVDSCVGEGTTFRMHLPLSMSISQVMQIRIDGQLYGVPMDQVAETVRLPVGRLHTFKDHETILLRDRVVPVMRSRDQLGLAHQPDGDTVALLIVRQRGELVALAVDEFSESVEVILKPMEGALENLGVYQGTALLGNGSVLLVLNLGVLLSSAKSGEAIHEHSGQG